jgi:hypothetical protein
MIPHNCPNEDYDEVLVPVGRPCPNGCGWISVEGDAEEFAVKEAAAALALWGPWVRLLDAANESGIAFSTIAQAAREGRLPTLQIGRQKFVRVSAVRARLSNKRGHPIGIGEGLHRPHIIVDRRRRLALSILEDSGEMNPRKLAEEIKRRMPGAFEESDDGIADAMLRDLQYLRDELSAVEYNAKHHVWKIRS